ncbi:MAG: hypothetical protein IBX55_10790 [Methyloprofundus sp.]|nr:hypothetical protein [Methyloprofundus sp.]
MSNDNQEIVVTDIQIPFWSMVVLMVKLAIASIPALFILSIFGMLASGFFMMFFGGMGQF